ncbi:MAG: glycoside hydrolase family 130 protein [Novosphingobium sp.]
MHETTTRTTPFFNRQTLHLRPDPARVVLRPFEPAPEPRALNRIDKSRACRIFERILALDEMQVEALLAATLANFRGRHRNLLDIFDRRATEMSGAFACDPSLSEARHQLIGAYFLNEYSFEAAALFNPSIVPHPDQFGTTGGRFILSARAVGEGHISSLTFRTGNVAADGAVTIDSPERLASVPEITARVGDRVELAFDPASEITERVIFPITEHQANGIEDARFVAFEDKGKTTYYATYTAYSGQAIRSELLETEDFVSFRMAPLKGVGARNKGMALFPRKIDGRYAMIARHDNENLYLIYSDNLHEWEPGQPILQPAHAWEFIQIGNCGSPIELDEGWLLFTHGVGPVRHYSIGAVLLDKDDPSKVIGRSRQPLIQPTASEREGYVPNVVYTCGAMQLEGRIVLPYAISDTFSTFATVETAALLELLKS